MKTRILFALLLTNLVINAQENYKFFGNFSYDSIVYEVKILTDESNKSYKVQICKSKDDYEESVSLSNSYNQDIFFNALIAVMNKPKLVLSPAFDSNKNDIKTQWKGIYEKLMKELHKKEVLTELYDNQNIEYSGKIRLKKEVTLIPYYDECMITQMLKKEINENGEKSNREVKTELAEKLAEFKKDNSNKSIKFITDYSSIRFYNNRINTIAVVGKINDKEYTIRNNKFSVPFRFLNNNKEGSYLQVFIDGTAYLLNWDDLLDYNPYETEFNFTVKNKNYKLSSNDEVKIESRNLFDYFTAIIFSDFLGLNSSGNNSLLMAEARGIIPLALVNKSQHNLINYFEGFLTTSLYNGQEEGTNFVTWKSDAANGGIQDKIVLFEFFKKRNIETGLNFGIYNFEWKGISTNIIFDYGVQFYRTKLRYIKDDQNNTEDYQVYCVGHGPKIKFEIRPQVNFGADLNIGFLGFNFNGMNTSGTLRNELKSVIEDKPTFLNNFYILTNFYTKLNDKESNSGLYFRLGGFYDFDTSDIAPQVMVGYATNLTSFINKFKKKDEVTSTSN